MNNKKLDSNTLKKNKHDIKHDIDDYMFILMDKHNIDNKFQKKFFKVENEEIPLLHEYSFLLKNNYNLNQLKIFVKHYKLKITGNKTQLTNRLYYHLYFSFYAVKIQKNIRGYLRRKYNNLRGPALCNRSLCVNACDFLTIDDLKDISVEQFFSYKDDDGFIYGFDILSLYNLISKCNGIIKNPYNRRPISKTIIEDFKYLIRLSKILGIKICTDLKEIACEISQEKSLELRILTLFQEIDSLGNYSNPIWFSSLNRNQLIKFLRELLDIWSFRSQLSNQMKILICPPLGNPFSILNPINHLINLELLDEMQKFIMDIIEKIVNNNADRDNKSLGAYYVLGALTLVNEEAAQSLPWLYQSFCYSV